MKLTVFDLDHTLLKVNCSNLFGTYLYRHRFFSLFSFATCVAYYARHKIFGMSLQKLHEKIFEQLFKGCFLEDIQAHAKLFLEKHLDQLFYEPTLKRLREAQQRGDYTLILSSSPDFLVGPIAERLQLTEWKSSVYAANEKGVITHLASILEGQGKADYVMQLMEQLHLDASSVTVYSDSYLDLPVLKIAGKAIGVVPDSHLKRICQKEGWEII